MATWEAPKTNWQGSTDSEGNYQGDRFNAADFNRIKNNLDYLRELAVKMYKDFTLVSLGRNRTYSDYFYADEINKLEDNLTKVNTNTLRRQYGSPTVYMDNGNTMSFKDLNRLEGAISDLYDRLTNERNGCRTFQWSFGEKGGGF